MLRSEVIIIKETLIKLTRYDEKISIYEKKKKETQTKRNLESRSSRSLTIRIKEATLVARTSADRAARRLFFNSQRVKILSM